MPVVYDKSTKHLFIRELVIYMHRMHYNLFYITLSSLLAANTNKCPIMRIGKNLLCCLSMHAAVLQYYLCYNLFVLNVML